jgi:hypothetical protein
MRIRRCLPKGARQRVVRRSADVARGRSGCANINPRAPATDSQLPRILSVSGSESECRARLESKAKIEKMDLRETETEFGRRKEKRFYGLSTQQTPIALGFHGLSLLSLVSTLQFPLKGVFTISIYSVHKPTFPSRESLFSSSANPSFPPTVILQSFSTL